MSEKTLKLGNKDITINAIHSYTYPDELQLDDQAKVDAWLTCAGIFHTYLNDEYTPEKFKNDPDIWKKYVKFLIDISKAGNVDSQTIVESAMSYAKTGTSNISAYPWDVVEIIDYFSTVFFYRTHIAAMRSVGGELVNKAGKITKRLRNYVYKTFDLTFPDVFWEFLGGIIRGFACEPAKTVYWRITDNLLWVDGSFADSGSCVMSRGGSYRDGLRMLIDSGSYAIQFFSTDTPRFSRDGDRKYYTNGIGRAWLTVRNEGDFFIFNGYGTDVLNSYGSSSKCTDKIASILGEYVGVQPRKVDLEILPDVMYLNDDSHCQYFGPDDSGLIRHVYTLDYDTYIDDEEDYRVECYQCGRRVHEEDSYNYEGDYYCEHCFNDQFSYCHICHEYRPAEDFVDTRDGMRCSTCGEDYTECHVCGAMCQNDTIIQSVAEMDGPEVSVCDRCIEREGYVPCDDCGVSFAPGILEFVDELPYCSDCIGAHREPEED